ncbi:MAG: nucleotidyltransferase domain-containing protein [Rhodospirillaceae bacterium]|nr:nucleotidyltransferase domain-containing protein [Rhodospirillaceae bacterium]
MKKSDVIHKLKAREPEIRARGARALYIFGSVRHDRATESSDVDLIVDYDPHRKFSLIDLVGLQQFIEDDLEQRVELLTIDGIHHRLREPILADAERVF